MWPTCLAAPPESSVGAAGKAKAAARVAIIEERGQCRRINRARRRLFTKTFKRRRTCRIWTDGDLAATLDSRTPPPLEATNSMGWSVRGRSVRRTANHMSSAHPLLHADADSLIAP